MPSPQRNVFGVMLAVDVVLGVAMGGVLALITGFVIVIAKDVRIQRPANGWTTTLACGQHRSGAILRAACATDIAALNLPAEEVYWQTYVDSAHRRLDGRRRYVLHFPPGAQPPASAAWSVTMGDWRRRMVENPIHRYSLGASSGLAPNADGSLDILIQNAAPAGRQSNWLPAPAGAFMLWLRVYQPGPAILSGAYRPPPVAEVTGGGK